MLMVEVIHHAKHHGNSPGVKIFWDNLMAVEKKELLKNGNADNGNCVNGNRNE